MQSVATTSDRDYYTRAANDDCFYGGPRTRTKYTYDVGTNGKGRLTGASDANHTLAWTYDALGRVTGKGQTVGGVTKSVGYGYTNGDLTTVTTPSGQTVSYTYGNHQITGIAVNGGTLLNTVAYEPMGPVRGWSWGNGTTEVRLHDTDGNQSQLSAIESTSLSYDAGYRLTNLTNSSNTALSWTVGYDSLDRTTSASQTAATLGYTYDGDGNRQTQSGSPAPGPLLASGASFTYNDRGRMSSATEGGGTTNYTYNAVGQMIQKSNGTTTMLVYDEAGHLQGEYTSGGSLIQETVWLNDVPVATLRPNGTGISVYYVHADQLNAPRMVTRPADNGIMWRWDSDPFGNVQPNQNPQSLGTFVYNLRFPGQYYQAETGLNYNYFRDYDSNTGRYVESDPIGLAGGSPSTYAYAGGNPLSNIDPLGLYLRVIGNTPAEQTALQDALNVVASTQRGSQLISTLQNSPDLYVIANRATNNAYFLNQIISVDPNFHPKIHTTCGDQEAPTSIILGHEIGHAVRNDLPPKNLTDEWNDVLENENPIRQQLGLPLRTSY